MVFASARQTYGIRRSNFELNVITKNLSETTVSRWEYLYAAINNIPASPFAWSTTSNESLFDRSIC